MATTTRVTPKNGTGDAIGSGNGSAAASVPHLTVAERVARGKAARAEVPRASHATFTPLSGRADPIELLEGQAATRVPELVPIRYGRMLVSPFTFYRGAARENLQTWYSQLATERLLGEYAGQFKQKMVKRTKKTLAKARTKDSMAAFSKLTHVVDGQVRIIDQSPLIVPIDQLAPGQERE